MQEIQDYFEKLINSWGKKRGLFITFLVIISIYFSGLKGIIKEGFSDLNFYIINLIIPIFLLFIILIIWLFTTNRVPLPKRNTFTLGVFLRIDEEESEKTLKKIAKQTIEEIDNKYPSIKIILKPINFIRSKEELFKHLNNNSHSYDSCIFANVNSGKEKNGNGDIEEKIEINEIHFTGKFNVKEKFKLFKTTISISNDLKIRNINRNWSFIESNSYNDKKKLKENLKDTILFYAGIYLIYERKTDIALEILKTLHNPIDSKAQINHKERKIFGNDRFISAARLNEILLNLFVSCSASFYNKKEVKSAYDGLKECENIFGYHPQSYEHFISLARYTYELGNLDEAIDYTEKAKQIKKYGTEVYINQGFFSILNKNEKQIIDNYNELRKTYLHYSSNNYTEIIGWLEERKSDENSLIEFAIGFFNFFYSDKKLGEKILENLKNKKLKKEYPLMFDFIEEILKEGEIRSAYYRKYSQNNKGPKRRKRKNRK